MMNNIKKNVRTPLMFIVLTILFIIALVLNINTGSVNISVPDIFKIIFLGAEEGTTNHSIIWKIRLPRLLVAAVLGGALSTAGYLLQAFFRNPIAGPFVLGISSGAKMSVGFAMIIVLQYTSSFSMWGMVAAAFVGALLSMGFVLIFAKRVSNMSMLLVVGIMIGYICSAATDFLITFASESEIANLTTWSMGSFSGSNWAMFKISAIIVFSTLIITICFSKPISAYQLGESYAQSMGVNIKFFRVVLILLSSILAATVTAFAGPISFVGIAVPHISKLSFKTAKPIVIIPATFFCGAIFCMYCDLVARTIFAPTELNIGTVTAAFGAPIVIWQMVSRKRNSINSGG